MNDKDKTIVERLENIEDKVNKINHTKKPISSIIGMPFSEYLEKSTIYYYADDSRKFNNEKKKQQKILIILISLIGICLLFNLIIIFMNIIDNWFAITPFILALAINIIALLRINKTTIKFPVSSPWNYKRIEFYILKTENNSYLEHESKKNLLFYVDLILKLLWVIASVFLMFYLLTGPLFESTLICVIDLIILYIVFLAQIFIFNKFGIKLEHNKYIFEHEDSYVIYPGLDYFEK